MTLSAAIIDALLQSGATREQIAAAIKADIAERAGVEAARLEAKRQGNRERQQRKRAGLSRSVTYVTRDAPLIEDHNPPVTSPKPNGLAPKPKTKDRGSRLAGDWSLPAEWGQWARDRRKWSEAEVSEEAEIFANYWQAKSGAGACHTDWFKTWRNWVIRSHRPDGKPFAVKVEGPMSAEQLRSAIRYHRDNDNEAKAQELEDELRRLVA